MLGVLGGMGPRATADFMHKLVAEMPATRDQDHLPVIVHSQPQTPDRSASILGQGPSPFPAMKAGIRLLERAGASCIAIPCNTAHHWHAELQKSVTIRVLHIVDAVLDEFGRRALRGPLGVLATAGTVTAQIYQKRLFARGLECVILDRARQARLVDAGIALVKAGEPDRAKPLFVEAAAALRAAGAGSLVLGCTEIPVGLADGRALPGDCIDSTRALARGCVARFARAVAAAGRCG